MSEERSEEGSSSGGGGDEAARREEEDETVEKERGQPAAERRLLMVSSSGRAAERSGESDYGVENNNHSNTHEKNVGCRIAEEREEDENFSGKEESSPRPPVAKDELIPRTKDAAR